MRLSRHKSTTSIGTLYEKHCAMKFRLRGYLFVKRQGKSGDFGADIIMRGFLLRKIIVQCKHYKGKVGVHAVQEAIAAKQYYRASKAIVVTNSTFTKAAKDMAKRCHVKLKERF